jgi:ATP-dependent 26S proteasome regulatory subunit
LQLYCGFPDEAERLSILHAISRKLKLANDANDELERIAKVGTELTGADLQALLATAQLLAVHSESTVITADLLSQAFQDTRPSVSQADRRRLEMVYKAFRGDREPPRLVEEGMMFDGEAKQKVALM